MKIPAKLTHLTPLAGRIFSRSAVLAVALLAAAGSARAEVAEDFESSPNMQVEGSSDNSECTVVDDPANAGNHVMKLSWKEHSGTHVAGNLVKPGGILISEPGVYEITAKVNLEQCPPEITAISIRVVDSGNETFQYTAPVDKAGEPGWTEMKWTINTNDPLPEQVKSWGQRVDGAMDFPVRFLGFASGLKDWKTTGGALLFDDISATKISD